MYKYVHHIVMVRSGIASNNNHCYINCLVQFVIDRDERNGYENVESSL